MLLTMLGDIVATVAFGVWVYLLIGRGGFWLAGERDTRHEPGHEPDHEPGPPQTAHWTLPERCDGND